MGVGEVFGHFVQHDGQHDTGGHREECAPFVHVEVRQHREGCHADGGGGVEALVDGLHGVLVGGIILVSAHQIGADDGGHHADAAHQQREYDPFHFPGDAHERQAQDQAGDDGDFIRLEDVCRHTGAVAHVVAHQVGDDGGVPGVIFGDTGFNLAHKVRAYVGGLGEDTAAHPHEERKQRAAEAEAQQCVRRGDAEHDEDQRAAQQAQAVGQHAGDGAGAVGDFKRLGKAPAGGGGHAHVALHGHPHAELADHQREHRAHDEGNGAAYANNHFDLIGRVASKALHCLIGGGDDVYREKQDYSKDCDHWNDGLQLAAKIGLCAGANGVPYLLHFFRAFVCLHHLFAQQKRIGEAEQGDQQHDIDGNLLKGCCVL